MLALTHYERISIPAGFPRKGVFIDPASWVNNGANRCRCKLAIFLLGVLGGFTQKQITQALPKAKNNTILKTGSSTHRHRSEPYELLTTLSSGDILRRSWLSGREGRLLKVEDLKAQLHDRGSLR